jgi:integrase/recombinase XerD
MQINISSVPDRLQKLLSNEEKLSLEVSENMTPIWEYWEEFLYDYYVIRGRSLDTVKNVRDKLRFLLLKVGVTSIEEANEVRTIKRFLAFAKEERNWAPNTYNTYKKDLNTYFKWLEENELIEENKFRKVSKLKVKTNEQSCLTADEVNHIKTYVRENPERSRLQTTRNELLLNLLFITGIRTIEASTLKKSSIFRERGRLVIKIEGAKQKGKVRKYVLPIFIEEMYRKYLNELSRLNRTNEHLFVSYKVGKGWTKNGIQKYLRKLSKNCGVKVTVYSIRRYVATHLYEQGVILDKIRSYLGHSRSTTTLSYIENTSTMTVDQTDVMVAALR